MKWLLKLCCWLGIHDFEIIVGTIIVYEHSHIWQEWYEQCVDCDLRVKRNDLKQY